MSTLYLERRKQRLAIHMQNCIYVMLNHEHLRYTRGLKSQTTVARLADVTQAYISRVESGVTEGIGCEALCRILETYKELECL